MPLDVVYGEPRNRPVTLLLAENLKNVADTGTIYLGYPVLATADERVYVDALLVSLEHGLVAFQVADALPNSDSEWRAYVEDQDRLYSVLESHLGRHDSLRRGRHLAFDLRTITVFAGDIAAPDNIVDQPGSHYCSVPDVKALVESFPPLEEAVMRALQGALQRVTTIKPRKRRSGVAQPDSRGAKLKEIERGIANLDRWQKQAAIETPNGPQRIRGLAGSGKTVVLALKAAYLHAQHPEWRIAVSFQSRALYQQFEDLITRFTFEHSSDKPDFERLLLLHAWGAYNRDGVYKTIARHMGAPFRDFRYANATYGRDAAFQGVCRELLDISSQSEDSPLFDAVLIDEAQDLPPEFFQLVYRFTEDPKRIVWAFDELQNLSDAAMPATDELFGRTDSGESLVSLADAPGEPRRDVILPICYRNSPWALATAHALGFGIYRKDGLVQHFDDTHLWEQIGYHVVGGRLQEGRKVQLERSPNSYPPYFTDLLKPDDAVVLKTFATQQEQDSWIAQQIVTNLQQDELDYDDILIVLPSAYTSKNRASRLGRALARNGISSHLAGVGSSVDELFVTDSIALAHIYRAKGNEAPVVYVVDAQYGASDINAVTARNTLFTAITRSRAWVRITGWGSAMDEIADEVRRVQLENFELKFTIPTAKQREKLRRIHRERSDAEVERLRRATQSLTELLEDFDKGDLDLDDLSPTLRRQLTRLLTAERSEGANAEDDYDGVDG